MVSGGCQVPRGKCPCHWPVLRCAHRTYGRTPRHLHGSLGPGCVRANRATISSGCPGGTFRRGRDFHCHGRPALPHCAACGRKLLGVCVCLSLRLGSAEANTSVRTARGFYLQSAGFMARPDFMCIGPDFIWLRRKSNACPGRCALQGADARRYELGVDCAYVFLEARKHNAF